MKSKHVSTPQPCIVQRSGLNHPTGKAQSSRLEPRQPQELP